MSSTSSAGAARSSSPGHRPAATTNPTSSRASGSTRTPPTTAPTSPPARRPRPPERTDPRLRPTRWTARSPRSRAPAPHRPLAATRSSRQASSRPRIRPGASTATSSRPPGTGGAIRRDAHCIRRDLRLLVGDRRRCRDRRHRPGDRGPVSEFNGLTEITVADAAGLVKLPAGDPVTPVDGAVARHRRRARGARVDARHQPTGDLHDHRHLLSTNSVRRGRSCRRHHAADPAHRGRSPGSAEASPRSPTTRPAAVVLDDGASTNFLSAANQGLTPTYVSLTNPVRVGAAATFTAPVIVDFRNNVWTLNPTTPYLAGGTPPVTFENDRTAAPGRSAATSGRLVQRAQLLHDARCRRRPAARRSRTAPATR